MEDYEVLAAEPRHRGRAAEILTEAFALDPLYSAVMPEEKERRKWLAWLHRTLIRYCTLYGEVRIHRSLQGVACHLPPGDTDVNPRRIIRSGLYAMPFHMGYRAYHRFHSYSSLSDRIRAENAPDTYWYLWLLGVDPRSQGRGVGSGLVRDLLDRADAAGASCYLETEKEENLRFYESHGFAVASRETVFSPDVFTWSMIRRPNRP